MLTIKNSEYLIQFYSFKTYQVSDIDAMLSLDRMFNFISTQRQHCIFLLQNLSKLTYLSVRFLYLYVDSLPLISTHFQVIVLKVMYGLRVAL